MIEKSYPPITIVGLMRMYAFDSMAIHGLNTQALVDDLRVHFPYIFHPIMFWNEIVDVYSALGINIGAN